jgi:hypothetical protein
MIMPYSSYTFFKIIKSGNKKSGWHLNPNPGLALGEWFEELGIRCDDIMIFSTSLYFSMSKSGGGTLYSLQHCEESKKA